MAVRWCYNTSVLVLRWCVHSSTNFRRNDLKGFYESIDSCVNIPMKVCVKIENHRVVKYKNSVLFVAFFPSFYRWAG
jgi:hypothetical protein